MCRRRPRRSARSRRRSPSRGPPCRSCAGSFLHLLECLGEVVLGDEVPHAVALGLELLVIVRPDPDQRSEEHTSELQSLMRSAYAVFCLKKKQLKESTVETTLAAVPEKRIIL